MIYPRQHSHRNTRKSLQLTGVVFCLTLVSGWSEPALALRCQNGLVTQGQTLYEVERNCGQPTLSDSRLEESQIQTRSGFTLSKQRQIEEWTYDFGPNRLAYWLEFHNGRLVKIETQGHGGYPTRSLVSLGDSLSRVILVWGEPTSHDRRTEIVAQPRYSVIPVFGQNPRGLKTKSRLAALAKPKLEAIVQRTVMVDRLVYDKGADQLVQILIFQDGRLVEKRSGSRGLDTN